jgi:outer membrane protein assembly factor BamA
MHTLAARPQVHSPEPGARLVVDGSEIPWPENVSPPGNRGRRWREDVVETFRRRGFFLARIDSVGDGPIVYLTRGRAAVLDSLIQTIRGDRDVSAPVIPPDLRPVRLDEDSLRAMLDWTLGELARRGRLAAAARVDSVRRSSDRLRQTDRSRRTDVSYYDVFVSIDAGPVVRLAGVELRGDDQTRPGTAAFLAGVRPGDRAGNVPLDDVESALRASGLFRDVSEPYYVILPDSTARLVVPVQPAPPGSFDLTLGLLPSGPAGKGPRFVGNGSIELNNAFGAGRRFDVRLDRRPGQVSSFDAGASDPFVAGFPVRVDLGFSGLQQDSTWSDRSYSATGAWRFGSGLDDLEAGARYTRELTRPGQAGLRLVDGVQRIARTEQSWWGVEMAIRRVDDPLAPRTGVVVRSVLERGRRISRRRIVDGADDTTSVAVSGSRERMRLEARGYLPVGDRFTLVTGGEFSMLSADELDESDLFRIGGANSLRGYDEDRFRGTSVGRSLLEIRSWIERRSYAYIFLDMGFVHRPAVRDLPASRGVHPGFGLGVQFRTGAGLMNVSWAMNDTDPPSDGRIHVSFRFGL